MPATVFGMTEPENEESGMFSNLETAQNVAPAEQIVEDLNFPSELSEPMWSVVTFETVAASSLSYDEAQNLAAKLEKEKVSGICIITDEAAQRIAN
mgnify:CR=1 FL=1